MCQLTATALLQFLLTGNLLVAGGQEIAAFVRAEASSAYHQHCTLTSGTAHFPSDSTELCSLRCCEIGGRCPCFQFHTVRKVCTLFVIQLPAARVEAGQVGHRFIKYRLEVGY